MYKNKKSQNSSSDYLYLKNLVFNPELRKTWLNFFVTNFRVVILMIFLITLWGVYAYSTLPRESNPEVKIPIAIVSTVYKGASPTDIEELITKKLEVGISGLKGIDKINSTSSNSVSSIRVEFDAKEDLENSIRKLREEINNKKKDLPVDAEDPIITEVSPDDTPILSIAVTGPYNGFYMRQLGEDIQDELEKISGIREVKISGGDEKEFEVAYDPQKLASFNISADSANQVIMATNLGIPAGNFEGDKYNYPVRVDARIWTVDKLQSIPITHTDEGSFIYLRDIADISEHAIEKTVYSRISLKGNKSEDALTISIIKKTGGNVIKTVDSAKEIIDRIIALHKGVKYDTTIDFGKIINEDFTQLKHDFLLTIFLVFVILFLIVGVKEAFVAGLAVPLVFCVTFGIMLETEISLNFLSNLSLLLALGLLVDDAIVVVSATKQYLRTGKFTPEEAVLLVLNDFKVVLTTTTLTTVWAFIPLLMASGIIGEYIKSIPIVVSVILISSLFIALMINHPLAAILERIRITNGFFWSMFFSIFIFMILTIFIGGFNIVSIIITLIILTILFLMIKWFLKKGKNIMKKNLDLVEAEWENDELIKKKLLNHVDEENQEGIGRFLYGIIHFDAIIPIYEKYLRKMLETKKRRLIILLGTFCLFVFTMLFPVIGIVPSEFFPKSDMDLIFINLKGPTGLRLDEINKITLKVEERLLKYPEIENFTTLAGGSSSLSSGHLAGGDSVSSHIAVITIKLKDKNKRSRKSYELEQIFRSDFADIQGAEIIVNSQQGGPPTGAAFEARITGEDLQVLDSIAYDLKPILASINGVVNIDISLKEAPAEYTFFLDPIKMEIMNINAAMIGSTLRMAIAGTKVSTILIDGKEIEIKARFSNNKITTLEDLQNLQILNKKGQSIFLKDVSKIELKPAVESITRIDQKRTVLLSAGVEGKTRPNDVLKAFDDKVKKTYKMKDGYTIFYGGENEQNAESVLSIIRAMIVAALLIISTLVVQFNSFRKACIVLVTVPLAMIGVFLGFAITRLTLSFPALIGILALFGIVVKNAIILIDKMNLNIKSGIPFFEAVIDACKSRIEAIFITSICTIVGLIPVTISDETWMALGSAVIFGLTLSSFFTLFIVPILFVTLLTPKNKKNNLINNQ